MLHMVKKLDFRFLFDTTTLSAGSYANVGDSTSYTVWDGSKWNSEYELDEQTVAEIAGIEIIPPKGKAGIRDKLEYVRLRINGEEYKHVNFNEQMCPQFSANQATSLDPFFGGSVKVGDAYEQLPHSFCHNIGVPMLLGGDPTEGVPKVGPGQKIDIEVRAPRSAEGGADITTDLTFRLNIVECRTTDMFKQLGEHYGWLNGNTINQDFVFRDFEENGDIAEHTVTKNVDMSETGIGFALDDWTEVYGGLDAKKPYIYPFITYANNAADTTTNSEYLFTKVSSKVLHDQQELDWSFEKKEALKIDYIGTNPHVNHKYTRLYVQGRDANPYAWTPDDGNNEYPMPLAENYATQQFHGPAALGRGGIIWNNKGHVGVMDNGTSIGAWSETNRGANVSVWGKHYKFN